MSVIQKIRDKYAWWSVVAIVLSLLGFILMDAFAGRGSVFSGNTTTLGKINGEKVDAREFASKLEYREAIAKQQGYNVTDANRQQLIDDVWNGEITEVLMGEEYEKLGLTVGDKELRDMLYGSNPPEMLRQQFTDPASGQYNAAAAQQTITSILRQGSEEQKAQLNEMILAMESERQMTKYTALLTNSVYIPKWFLEQQNVDNSLIARVSYVGVPYTTISDTAIRVTDDEIKAYISEHQDDFRQEEESRSFKYVMFNAAPSAADSAAARNALIERKSELATTTEPAALVARFGGTYLDAFINASDIQNPNKDSILAAGVGEVYGPYLDGGSYALSKIVDRKQVADTVTVRHVLIATRGQQGIIRDDSSASKLADSIAALHRSGTPFDTLVARYSDDPGSKATGGKYENITTGKMVPEFNDFIFTNPTGKTGVVKTDYGYHYVEILSQKGSSPGYKIAYLYQEITPSQETENAANNAASAFAGNVKDLKSFDAQVDKELRPKGIQPLIAEVRPVDYTVQGLGTSRNLVREIFEADKGDVVGPELVDQNFVVAVVTDVTEPGLAPVSKVRPYVEPILRNRKKAEQIRKNIGKFSTLEEVAQKSGQPVQVADSVRFNGGNSPLGFEFRVLGAAFNPSNKGKVVTELLEGQQGMYAIRVENVATTPVDANIADQRQMLEMQARQRFMQQSPVDVLRRTASIKDNRARFY